jgi:hypothetical protein
MEKLLTFRAGTMSIACRTEAHPAEGQRLEEKLNVKNVFTFQQKYNNNSILYIFTC